MIFCIIFSFRVGDYFSLKEKCTAFDIINTVDLYKPFDFYWGTDKNRRLVMINSICHVKYSVRNSLDKLERFQGKSNQNVCTETMLTQILEVFANIGASLIWPHSSLAWQTSFVSIDVQIRTQECPVLSCYDTSHSECAAIG